MRAVSYRLYVAVPAKTAIFPMAPRPISPDGALDEDAVIGSPINNASGLEFFIQVMH